MVYIFDEAKCKNLNKILANKKKHTKNVIYYDQTDWIREESLVQYTIKVNKCNISQL